MAQPAGGGKGGRSETSSHSAVSVIVPSRIGGGDQRLGGHGSDRQPARPGDQRGHGGGAPGRRAGGAGVGAAVLCARLALAAGARRQPLVSQPPGCFASRGPRTGPASWPRPPQRCACSLPVDALPASLKGERSNLKGHCAQFAQQFVLDILARDGRFWLEWR